MIVETDVKKAAFMCYYTVTKMKIRRYNILLNMPNLPFIKGDR